MPHTPDSIREIAARRAMAHARARTASALSADAQSSGMNYGGDNKIEQTRPDPLPTLAPVELEGLSSHGLGRRITWGVAGAMLRAPWEVEGYEVPRRLRFREQILTAIASARALGGAHLMPVIRGEDDLSTPLPPGPHEVLAVHVLTARDARPRRWVTDWTDPAWTLPEVWDVQPVRPMVSVVSRPVHRSRLIYIPGMEAIPSQSEHLSGYDVSVLEAYWRAIRRVELALESATLGAVELSTPWVRLASSEYATAGDAADDVDARLRLLRDERSMARMSVLLGDDEMGRDNVSLTGLRGEVVIGAYESVCSVEGLPLTWFFGMPPAGFSSDDEAGRRGTTAVLDALRRSVATPAIQRLVEMMTGEVRDVEWSPLDDSVAADTVALVGAGIADPDEVRHRHGLPPREVEAVSASQEEVAAFLAAMQQADRGAE